MKEAPVEQHLANEVRRVLGGVAVKLNPFGYVGIPDRLVLAPGPLIAFVELKRPKGGVVSKKQAVWHQRLRDWGFEVKVLNTKEKIDEWTGSKRAVGHRE